jgi:AraC-like DNA-binding protein
MTVAPTLGAAIGDLVTNHPRYVRGGGPYLIDLDTGHTLIGYRTHLQDLQGKRHLIKGTVAFGYSVFSEISGIAPEFVHISLPKPADVSAYRTAFPRAKLIFDSQHYGLAYARHALDKPLPQAHAERRRELERGLEEMWRLKQPDIREQVLRVLVPAVFSGTHNLTTTARRLDLSPRALDRQLHAQGTTFRELLKAARFEMASQLLMDTQLTIEALAETLGYSEISAFTRFFTRLTGLSPTEWRKIKATGVISA